MFQFLPSQFHVTCDEVHIIDYSFMNINRLNFRKYICHWRKETDWKMIRDITFGNCYFKSKFTKKFVRV